MTDAADPAPAHSSIGGPASARPIAGLRRPENQVWLIGLTVLAAAIGIMAIVPDHGSSTRPGGWWAFIVVAVLCGLSEYTVFNVQFNSEGHGFGMSELPLAFAIVFLAPLPAIAARLVLSAPVVYFPRRNRGFKLVFNLSNFAFEAALTILIYRALLSRWGDDDVAVIASAIIALMVVAPVVSALISIVVARFEGGTLQRIVGELRGTWWLYAVNSVFAVMCVALALIQPALALVAIPPAFGVWYVLRSYGELAQEMRDLDALHGFAGRVGGTLDANEIADVAVAEVVAHLRAQGAALVRFTADAPIVHQSGRMPVELPSGIEDARWSELIGAGTVQAVDDRRLRELGISVTTPARSVLVAPITDETGTFALLVVVERDIQRTRFDDGEVARLRNITHQLAVSLRRGMLHERLEYEARHDALTDLPARTLFERYVADAIARPTTGGVWVVMMLDLDRFKEVNDTLGHHAGDELLVEFSRRMSSLLERDDRLARLAGDEFALLCRRDSHDEVLEMARRVVREGGRPVTLDGLEIVVTVSVGVADILDDDSDALQPMRRADIAMYNAKWQRTGVEFYRDEIDRRTPARLSMLGDLRNAIETDQLDVVYQPKLDLRTGVVIGVEALVRWEHDSRGVVTPTEFVRVAEDTGLIKELTDLVLARGISTLRRFDELGLGLGLAVNLSTHDLFDARLPDRVRAYLDENGVEPGALTLEITESSLLVDAPRTRATIDELHAVGLRLAVDDFGTGYSSLSYLRRLPVHELKIDQSFVSGMLTDPQDEVIVRSTVDLGHNLGLKVVAEGVESRSVLERLTEMGCDVAQGYVISRPLSADELPEWLNSVRAQPGAARSWLASST